MTKNPREQPDIAHARDGLLEVLRSEGTLRPASISALGRVPRERFVRPQQRSEAYENYPLDIGFGQTISQPSMVAWLCDAVDAAPGRRILEIGTGCGYQSAVLAEAGAAVWTIEIRAPLARRARSTLDSLGYSTVATRIGDGAMGWPEEAPFDAILLTAAPRSVPSALFSQLGPEGVLVAPVGLPGEVQDLLRFRSGRGGELTRELLGRCKFVPFANG